MTLARKNRDGSISVGGVHCPTCDSDQYHRVLDDGSTRCDCCGNGSKYKPRGLVVKHFSRGKEV